MLRRSLLAAGASSVLSLSALPRLALATTVNSADRDALHVLNRLAFGPSEADARHVKEIGVDAYIAEQLRPDNLAEPPELTARLAGLTTLQLDPVELFREYGPIVPQAGAKPDPDEQKARRQRARIIVQEACVARVWRALYSPRQLQEAMVDFWYTHFNVFADKGFDHLWVGAYERDAIRPHAFGRFRDLLGATAHHPAMMFYLDNFQNVAAGTKGPKGEELGINENYARELMELHTLGVDGGYSQEDVVALARILTGWSLMRPRMLPDRGSFFAFYPGRHDNGPKRFLGRDIQPNGEAEGEEALDMLARSAATAHHIATRLAQYFVADAPPPALVERVAARFAASDGDIRAVLQTLFASAEFRTSIGGKYKSPYRYVLSAARAAGVEVNNPQPLLQSMVRQGQPLYRCQTPDGYKDTEEAWLSPDATMLRVSFATGLAAGRLPLRNKWAPPPPPIEQAAARPADVVAAAAGDGATPPPADPVAAEPLAALLAPILSAKTRDAVAAAPGQLQAALLLGSPDFMRR
jgi:uncharacterized protein (DUF1800 family)